MPNLAPLYGSNKKIFYTVDGSFSLFNLSYNEAYRAKSVGAYSESLYKFVYPSKIIEKLQYQDIRVLDICFGLGYNIAITLDKVSKLKTCHKLGIVSLEIDYELIKIVEDSLIFFPVKGYQILKTLLNRKTYKNFSLNIKFGDASKSIFELNGDFDIIYFDPFSKSKNPEMWNKSIYIKLYSLLKNGGRMLTYACSKKIREEFKNAGFIVKDTPNLPKEFQPGTLLLKT